MVAFVPQLPISYSMQTLNLVFLPHTANVVSMICELDCLELRSVINGSFLCHIIACLRMKEGRIVSGMIEQSLLMDYPERLFPKAANILSAYQAWFRPPVLPPQGQTLECTESSTSVNSSTVLSHLQT